MFWAINHQRILFILSVSISRCHFVNCQSSSMLYAHCTLHTAYRIQVHVHSTYSSCAHRISCPKLHAYIPPYIVVLDTHRRALLSARPWRYALTIPERNVMQPHAADLRQDPETWSQECVFKDESPVTIFL